MTKTKPATAAPEKPVQLKTIGIIGGGQLAKMLAQSASQFGLKVVVLEKSLDCPAAPVSFEFLEGDWSDPQALSELAGRVDVLTVESEFVEACRLAALEKAGHTVVPSSATMKVVQDKFLQKEALSSGGLPVPKFRAVGSIAEIRIAGNEFGWPVVLKKRCNGYDGKGNFTIRSPSDISEGWRVLEGGKHPLMVEEFYPFTQELAVMIARGRDGSVVSYPVVQTVQEDHVCRTVSAPATVSESIAVQAREIAIKAVEQVGMVGTMGVEMFLTAAGDLCINELAPRVHNSGHYTIEACDCSQFENHIRAVLGWPLGSTAMVAPCAVMVNLLGTGPGSGVPQGLETVLGMPGVHLHLYGKSKAGKGRKMGHITVIGNQPEEVMARAEKAASSLTFV